MRTATLGISIETLDEVERQMQSLSSSSQSTPSNALALAAKSQPNTLMQQAVQLAAPIGTCKEVTLVHSLPNTHAHTHIQSLSLFLSFSPSAQNVFSYLSSFAPDSAPQAVPLLQRWLEQFERKLQAQGIEFLLRQT